ncbi:MAG: hypothetical protein OHK93_007763 [Ramalina farinacea]|uniref:Uncharacterized protein n=1 Tax=Ramalina farinacea TaxID=258253 RepID=A0AA43QL46_9LECA|nr:hypothetical protein [Ramalina farinacea]
MSGNTVNLNFFLAKNGISWENIGITKPNTECIAGQASTPASPRPSSPVSKRSSKSPTSEMRQQAARSLIRKWSHHQGVFERRRYPTVPTSPFASTFHIRNSPNMSVAQRRQSTSDITRFRMYIKQRTYDLAEDAAAKAREAAETLWAAYFDAMNAAMAAEDVAKKAEEALKKLKENEAAPAEQHDDTTSDPGDGDKTPTTPRWTLTNEGNDQQAFEGISLDDLLADPGADEHHPPFESISFDDFPEHKTMLDCTANQKAAGFADLAGRKSRKAQ